MYAGRPSAPRPRPTRLTVSLLNRVGGSVFEWRPQIRIPEAEREETAVSLHHGAKVLEAGCYQRGCDCGRLERPIWFSQFSAFTSDFAREGESGSKDRPRNTASRGLWHDRGSLCAVRHGFDARCAGQVPGAAHGRLDSPTHRASSVRIVGWIMGGRFRPSADKRFEKMVARDGIESPTPAFSGLDYFVV